MRISTLPTRASSFASASFAEAMVRWSGEAWRQVTARPRRGDIQKARAEGESRVPSAAKRGDGQTLGPERMRLYNGTREAMAGGGFGGQPVKGRDAEHGRPCWVWRVRHLPACNNCCASSTRFRRRRHDTTRHLLLPATICPRLVSLYLCISVPRPPFHPRLSPSAPPSAPSLADPVRATRPDLQRLTPTPTPTPNARPTSIHTAHTCFTAPAH
jgi:hypothetical protein